MKLDTTRWIALLGLIFGVATGYLGWKAYQHPSIIIEWSTASELEVAGFNLLRGEAPDGPFEKVNSELIPPSDDPLTGKAYSFVDESVEGGKTYFYQLQEVEMTGAAVLHSANEVQAKRGGILETALAGVIMLVSLFFLVRGHQP